MLLDESNPYDCDEHECLCNTDSIEVSALGITMDITKDDYEEFFDAVKTENIEQGGRSSLPDWIIIEMADFCPRFMFNASYYTAITYHNLTDGINANTPEELDEQLGLWVDACNIIGSQQNKWYAVKQKQEQERKSNGNKN